LRLADERQGLHGPDQRRGRQVAHAHEPERQAGGQLGVPFDIPSEARDSYCCKVPGTRANLSRILLVTLVCAFAVSHAQTRQPSPTPAPAAQPSPAPSPAQEVPAIDGGIGPCSLEMTVIEAGGKPVYAATVKVRITYGFAGIRKLNLEAGTNFE